MSNKDREELRSSCIDYFQKRKPYYRALEGMRRKWKQYGRPAGMIEIGIPTREEREVLGGFLGKEFFHGAIRFAMADFEAALKATRYGEISLEELLEGYFGEKLITNKEFREERAGKRRDFIDGLSRFAEETGRDSAAHTWITKMTENKKFGYQLILIEYEKSQEDIARHVENVCKALMFLDKRKGMDSNNRKNRNSNKEPEKDGMEEQRGGIRLAVLASELTRNPHEFDRNTVAGKLLIQALACTCEDMPCKSAEDILMLYYAAGIRPDDISSFTTIYGIRLYTERGEHPAYKSFRERGEPCVATLFNLSSVRSADAENRRVYVVENQMVFSHLCEELKGRNIALVCTSGQLKTASLILLDLLCAGGCELFYSGDFDPEGIEIAERIYRRNPEKTHFWCMTAQDYKRSLSYETVSGERLRRLENVKLPYFDEVKKAMLSEKRAGYQERLIGKLLETVSYDAV